MSVEDITGLPPVTKLDLLREIALDQHGLVTTAQAAGEGVTDKDLAAMVARKRLARVAHGVYRLPFMPVTEADQYQLAVLWTGAPEACLSHDTALQVWDISDINPTAIHVTVARHRRSRRQGGRGYVLHHEDLDPTQITWWEQIPTVTVPTAIRQCIATGVPSYLIRQALERAGKTSLLPAPERTRLTTMLEERDG
jgi:predicted transcriptional regulator of viral defense system